MLRQQPSPKQKLKLVLVGLLLMGLSGGAGLRARAEPTPPCVLESGQIVPTIVRSRVYSKPVAVNVYLPPCYKADEQARYPVIYLLHGGAADETQWPDLNVQSAANALIRQGAPPFLVVMPGAAYADYIDYGAFVIEELLPGIEAHYPVQAEQSGRGIGGLSMGGYYALQIAFLRPELFSAVGGYSPVVERGYPNDPISLARQMDVHKLQGLQIALDVGDQDSLRYSTQVLAQAFRAKDVPVSLMIDQGGHNRAYWRSHTGEYFRFFVDAFVKNHRIRQHPKTES